MHKENRLAKQDWKIIMIIKDLMLINSGLFNRFWAEIIETANYLQNQQEVEIIVK